MKTYNVTRRVDHDQKSFDEGDTIELDDDQAEPLLACGAIADPEGAPAPKSRKKK